MELTVWEINRKSISWLYPIWIWSPVHLFSMNLWSYWSNSDTSHMLLVLYTSHTLPNH